MQLLERDQFVAIMTSALRDVEAGSGRMVLVTGEAGIGKTTLVRQFAERHSKDAHILWGACEALFAPRPLGPFHDIARQTRGSLAELLNAEASRARIFSAFLDEIQYATPIAMVVIEDVHWADEATLDAIKFLGRRIHQIPALLIITYRDDELGAQHPLRFVLGDLPGGSVIRLQLPSLSEAAVAALAEQAHHSAEGLYRATGGNPFFVTEVLACDEQGIPITVRDAVLARVARLSPGAREVLELASVVPARVERWLLDSVGPFDSVLLDECVDCGMLRLDNASVAFRHDLARMAVEDNLSPARRQHLHAQVLAALTSRKAGEIALSRLAHHARHSGDREAVLRFAPLAAKQAASLGAHREAVSHYAAALDYADRLPPEERAELLENYAYESYLTEQIEEAIKARQGALEIWRELSRPAKVGHSLRWLSRLFWWVGKNAEADAYAAQAVSVLERLPPDSELAMAYSNCAQLYMVADETAKAREWGQRAIVLAEQLGNNEILVHALNNVGTALMSIGETGGKAQVEKSLQIALANGFEEHAARAYTNLASIYVRKRAYADAMRYLRDGLRYTLERDLDSMAWYMVAWRARCHLEQGYWQEATDDAQMVLSRARVPPISKIHALVVLALVHLRKGDPDADALLDEARDLAMPTGEIQRIAPVLAACAEYAWLNGDLGRCLAGARRGFELATTHRNVWELDEFSFWMWRGGGLVEPPPGIATPFALQMTGQWQAAAGAWEQLGCPYEQAMALADGDEAGQRAALQILVPLGAAPLAEFVRQKLRARGARGIPRGPRPTTRENPVGLTMRQMEVLTLMAEGLHNTEIANQLSTSPKTVGHHVSAVLAKLNVRSRAEAVIAAHQLSLISQDRESHDTK